MLANLPVEIILLICEYPEFKDLGQLAWTNKRMMQIIKRYLPIALERRTLFYLYYRNNGKYEGRIGLFNSFACSVEGIGKFSNYYEPYQVATTQNKVFGIDSSTFEIYNLNTRRISEGPDPPEWRGWATVAYFKDKLYYLGGEDPKTNKNTNRVDVLIDGKWQTGPTFPLPINRALTITCDETLCVINGKWNNKKISRLSDDEREWVEIRELPDRRTYFGVASLNRKIYITGGTGRTGGTEGWGNYDITLKSCLCFDPSARVGSRISRIANMNYRRFGHSLIIANGKLYAIGGFQNPSHVSYCHSIEEYDPQTNKWREVEKINIK